jgi:hypothetical protein
LDRPAADAVGVAGPFGAERIEKELLVERFLDVELVAGESFTGDSTGGVFNAILHKEPTDVARLNTAVPAELERIIGKAMEKDRDLPYTTAAELRTDLKRLKRDSSSGKVRRDSGSIRTTSGMEAAVTNAPLVATGKVAELPQQSSSLFSRKWTVPFLLLLFVAAVFATGFFRGWFKTGLARTA